MNIINFENPEIISMVTQSKDNMHRDLNNQGCLVILSWLIFNGFKCVKSSQLQGVREYDYESI